jgi:hypothetical protein
MGHDLFLHLQIIIRNYFLIRYYETQDDIKQIEPSREEWMDLVLPRLFTLIKVGRSTVSATRICGI